MLKQLLIATSLVSAASGADGLDWSIYSQHHPRTNVIVHNDCSDPTIITHKSTSFMEICGNIYFPPQYYFHNLDTSKSDIDFPLMDYSYSTSYTRAIRIWCDGEPDTIFLNVVSFIRGLDENNYYLMKLEPDVSSRKLAAGSQTKFILSFKKDGTFNCTDPGQPTQSSTSLTLLISSKFNEHSHDCGNSHPLATEKIYPLRFNLEGLTSRVGDSAIKVIKFNEE